MTEDIFDQIFRREYPRLYRQAYSMLRNAEECRDIVSQVMSRLYERPPRETDDENALAAYLSRAVRSRCIDYIEHQEVEHRARMLYPLEMNQDNTDDNSREMRINDIWLFINQHLTQQTRRVLMLRYEEEMTYAEVAEQLHISVSAVNKHIYEGLKKLREHFKKES